MADINEDDLEYEICLKCTRLIKTGVNCNKCGAKALQELNLKRRKIINES